VFARFRDAGGVDDIGLKVASYEPRRGKPDVGYVLIVVRGSQATLFREIVPCSFAAGVLTGKIALIFVPKALE
jgi:hypothetical protein